MPAPVGVACRSLEKGEPYFGPPSEVGVPFVGIAPEKPRTLDGLAGWLVTGGPDIDPRLYGQDPWAETDGPTDRERDALELQLIREALDQNLPLLAICRGMQMLNVALGGTLHQHIPQFGLHRVKPAAGHRHEVVPTTVVEPGTRLFEIPGVREHPLNSRHHQAVQEPGHGLTVSARASNGVIEAIELPSKTFVLDCQWHPEERIWTSPGDRKIFEALLGALS